MRKSEETYLGAIKEKLDYIGLNLNKVPSFFQENTPIEYRPTRGYDENKYNVYKYVDVRDIQILLTPTNRMDMLLEKYEKASPLYTYLSPEKEEDIPKHSMFLNMLHKVKIEEIKRVEKEQEILNKKVPFKVKYDGNYLWQIYYSEVSNQYFMLVPMIDSEYACFFYLLKKQIEANQKKKKVEIFVPICHIEYSGRYLKRSELADIENYLWLFTKDWPLVYEVFDKQNHMSIQIVGQTFIYEKIKSYYKVVLSEQEEAIEFFKLMKALFILQTETQEEYNFDTKISANGGLEFFYHEILITYHSLSQFIEEEYQKKQKQLREILHQIEELSEKLESMTEVSKQKEIEYLNKEKEIAMYLECRKTFLGKIKFFLKHKKKKEEKVIRKVPKEKEEKIKVEPEKIEMEKPFYTIEDLVALSKKHNQKLGSKKNIELDMKAMQKKIEILELKLKNATIYIDEIDQHKKSIFDFWKYTNKDNALALNEAREENKKDYIALEKTFNYEEDIEDLGKKVDHIQRDNLSKEECDGIFITTTEIINVLNIFREHKNKKRMPAVVTEKIEESLKSLQEEAEKTKQFFKKEEFDIFGGLSEDRTKIKLLSGKKHREIQKSKFRILDITKNTTTRQYKESLSKVIDNLEDAIRKGIVPIKMSLYIDKKELEENGFSVYHIDPKKVIEGLEKKKIEMVRINIEQGMHAIYLSNIMYFDNYNQTLPIGMELGDLVLIDNQNYELNLKNKSEFRTNYEGKDENKVETIQVWEYDMVEKTMEYPIKDEKGMEEND